MALWSAIVSLGADSALPKHRLVNTLHFNGVGTFLSDETDVQTIADEIANAYSTTFTAALREIDVRVYNLADEMPRPVRARKTLNVGSFPLSPMPREIALCLSFYGDRNLPRQRGRIYIPGPILSGTAAVKPTSGQMTTVLSLFTKLKDVGGTDLEWCVFSRADNHHYQVQHGWVDDEWDTVRSRGLAPTTRQLVTAEG